MSPVGQDFRGHRESRVLLADQDSLEPVGKTAAQEREVFQEKGERRAAQVWGHKALVVLQDLQGLLEKGEQEVRVHQGDLEFKAPKDVQVPQAVLVLLDRPATATRTPASGTMLEVQISMRMTTEKQ